MTYDKNNNKKKQKTNDNKQHKHKLAKKFKHNNRPKKITIVIDMTIGVKVIETDLNIQFAVEYRFHSMKGYREYTITSTEPESLEMRKNRPDEKVRSQEFLMRMCLAEEARQNNTA